MNQNYMNSPVADATIGAPGCVLASTPPTSRTERLHQYLTVLGDGVCKTFADFDNYITTNQQDYEQIHLDCLRSLWTFFQKGSWDTYHCMASSTHRSQYKPLIDKDMPHSFVRFHQCVLERFIIDTLSQKLTFSCYFQGYTYILEALYYTALRDEFLYPESSEMKDILALFTAEDGWNLYIEALDNYKPFTREFAASFDFRTMFTIPYTELLHIALELSRSTLFPFLHPDNNVMVSTVGLAFEPILRVIDAELYDIIGNHPSIGITCQAIQTSMVMTGCISLSNTVYGRLRFLDALVAGGIQFSLFLSAASFSLGARLHLPHMFRDYEPAKSSTNTTPKVDADVENENCVPNPDEKPLIQSYTRYHMLLLSKGSICESPYYPTVNEDAISLIDTLLPLTANSMAQDDENIVGTVKNAFTKVECSIPRLVDYAINLAFVTALLSTISKSFVDHSKVLLSQLSTNSTESSPASTSTSTPLQANSAEHGGCNSPSGPFISVAPSLTLASTPLTVEDSDILNLFRYLSTNITFVSEHDGLFKGIMEGVPFPAEATETETYYKKVAAGRFIDFSKAITFIDQTDSRLKYFDYLTICGKFNFRTELYISLLQDSREFDEAKKVKEILQQKNILVDRASLRAELRQHRDYKAFMKRNTPIIAGVSVAAVAMVAGVIGGIVGGLAFRKHNRPPK